MVMRVSSRSIRDAAAGWDAASAPRVDADVRALAKQDNITRASARGA